VVRRKIASLTGREAYLAPDNFYRQLQAKRDLSFVLDWAADKYAAVGRPSIDPVVVFKFELLLFCEGLRSERRLIETARLHLRSRWYLGYNFDEPLPDYSSLTNIRDRLGVETFQRFFEHIVDVCQAAGLVWGKELFVESTNVRANADIDSLTPRFYQAAKQQAQAHVTDLFTADGTSSEQATPFFTHKDFVYDAETDSDRCPHGETLRYRGNT
jgi:transposase